MKAYKTVVFISIVTACMPALAYVGPGAGLTFLGALLGLLAAIAAALMFVILWPLRQWRKRARAAAAEAGDPQATSSDQTRRSG